MPQYIVKVTDGAGWMSPPIIAHVDDEEEAEKNVLYLVGDEVKVEVKGIQPDVMIAAFGEVPKGAVIFRGDWTWSGESDDTSEPY
jgi:hypothetical protein